jgi:hypothetical protein
MERCEQRTPLAARQKPPLRAAPPLRGALNKGTVMSRVLVGGFNTNGGVATHSEAVKRGDLVLSLTVADDDRADDVSEIMEECGAVDIDARAELWSANPAQRSLLPDEAVDLASDRYAGAERRLNRSEDHGDRERRVGP